MKRYLTLVALPIFLAACDEPVYYGEFHIQKPFVITEKYSRSECNDRYDWWNCQDKALSLSQGAHKVKYALLKKGKDTVINFIFDNDKSKNIIITSPEINLNDEFHIAAADINQNFDISGQIDTDITRSSETDGLESCTYTTHEFLCHWVDIHTEKKTTREYICEDVIVSHEGRMHVRYYYLTTLKKMTGIFLQQNDELARFQTNNSNTDKIYTYKGACY